MRLPLITIIILLIVNLGTDAFIYKKINDLRQRIWKNIYLILTLFLYVCIGIIVFLPKKSIDNGELVTVMWLLFAYLTVYVPKYIYLIVAWFSKVPALWKVQSIPHSNTIGISLGFIVFVIMWWGALVSPYKYDVIKENLYFKDLPTGFNGYKIVQISDLHLGTYNSDTTFVSKVVKEINSLHPDIIFFTGDIVNRESPELIPFVPVLKRLKAHNGVYSILGNHDYGDYREWKSRAQKAQNMEELYKLQKDMGWHLLNNSYTFLHQSNDSIALIGVENWGDPPFINHANLRASYPNLKDNNFKILLSHNSAHWKAEVLPMTNIDLTLSGHTHAMQMMLNIFGFKISPAVLRYREWEGEYDENNMKLYVNIGLGEVAMPMRIGATPEITLITLFKSN